MASNAQARSKPIGPNLVSKCVKPHTARRLRRGPIDGQHSVVSTFPHRRGGPAGDVAGMMSNSLRWLTKKETETIVNTIFDNITDALSKGDKVELRGFGSFRIRHRNSRKGRNPKTGSSVDVPQKRVPFFKVGKRLRELVNG